jgi:F0F1-type ATP synthase delta subunit
MSYLTIRSAHTLTAAQVQSVVQTVEKKYSHKLSAADVRVEVDPSLLAGVEIQVGSQLIGSTLQQELQQLRSYLTQTVTA